VTSPTADDVVGAMAPIPSGRRIRYQRRGIMTDNQVQLFVAAFDNEVQAGVALKDFRAMDREGSIDLIDAVVLVHGTDDKVRFEETADPSGEEVGQAWRDRGRPRRVDLPSEHHRRCRYRCRGWRRLGQDPRQGIQGRGSQGDWPES